MKKTYSIASAVFAVALLVTLGACAPGMFPGPMPAKPKLPTAPLPSAAQRQAFVDSHALEPAVRASILKGQVTPGMTRTEWMAVTGGVCYQYPQGKFSRWKAMNARLHSPPPPDWTSHYCPQNGMWFGTDNKTDTVVGLASYHITPAEWWETLTHIPVRVYPQSVCNSWNGVVTCTYYPGGWQ